MVAALRLALLAALGVIFLHVAVADIVNGSSRADVIAELGKPASAAKRETHEILIYPKGVRIELENGLVTDIKGYTPPAVTAAATTPAPPAGKEPLPATPHPAPTDKSAAKMPVPAAKGTGEYNPADAANKLGDEVAKMDTAWGSKPPDPIHKKPLPWFELAIVLVMRFGFTLLALRLAFKYWEMDAFWSGTFAIAGIDTAFHGILEALGPASGGFTTMSAVENGIPGLLMIFTVRHFCFNKRIPNAVATAGAVKGIMFFLIIVVYALLGAVFGGGPMR